MSFYTDHDKNIVIPAVLRKGVWQPFYGGGMPKLKEGALADIVVPEQAFKNADELQRFNLEDTVTLLPGGSRLFAMMSRNHLMRGPQIGSPSSAHIRPQDGLGNANLVAFAIKQDLKLHLRGTKLAQLEPCECELEGFPENLAVLIINQGYTRLSERYEPTRKSHSGNVFPEVFFMERNRLLPLVELRVRAVTELEKRLYQQSDELSLDSRQPEEHD